MNQPETNSGVQSNRLIALDVFRGMTIALMILVNNPGSWSHVYPLLLHAQWHGILPADLVFPFFLFIVGVSMSFSFSRSSDDPNFSLQWKIAKRAGIIFLIGLALNYFPFYHKSISDIRIMGVLQRIGLAYGLAAIICVKLSQRNLWKVALVILLGYWAVLIVFCTADPFSLEGNISTAIDIFIFGTNHMYKGFGIPFDPEGLLGTIPASVSIIGGYLIGLKIKETRDKNILVKNLLLLGSLAVALGLLWDMAFPINKPLWSSSYVVFTAGIACICLGFLIEIIDINGYRKWTKPFVTFGLNPMILYVISILLVKILIHVVRWENSATSQTTTLYEWLYQNVFVSLLPANPEGASLLFALSTVLFCWIVSVILYNKKMVIKI